MSGLSIQMSGHRRMPLHAARAGNRNIDVHALPRTQNPAACVTRTSACGGQNDGRCSHGARGQQRLRALKVTGCLTTLMARAAVDGASAPETCALVLYCPQLDFFCPAATAPGGFVKCVYRPNF
jgi:hypothetical protein